MRKIAGFTLIELLIALSLLGILGLAFTDILVQTLRGQNKVRILNQVKQNGQVVLDRLISEISQAEKIVCIGTNEANLLSRNPAAKYDTFVIYKQSTFSRFRFYPPQEGVSNGQIKRNDFSADYIASSQASESQLCSLEADQDPARVLTITDTDTVTGVSLDYYDALSPIFALNQEAGQKDVLTIKFRAFQGVSAGSTYEVVVKEGGILFTTAVQARGGQQ